MSLKQSLKKIPSSLAALADSEKSPSTKKLFRQAVYLYILAHTLALIPYRATLWSNEGICARGAGMLIDWKSLFYEVLQLPALQEC